MVEFNTKCAFHVCFCSRRFVIIFKKINFPRAINVERFIRIFSSLIGENFSMNTDYSDKTVAWVQLHELYNSCLRFNKINDICKKCKKKVGKFCSIEWSLLIPDFTFSDRFFRYNLLQTKNITFDNAKICKNL